ncbi:signal peptidase II [Actinomyces sp. Z5]|uniref:Lipoprotein signal peptidase n=1 Tax=Actinomyces glycerinitolerans TaxID=1892869 RepID=A0A1M4S399_9ACTO|nr:MULTISPECIES: signal peptidase II [Actinomyces]RAX19324.1 signal peptidase II [Actinomyces sp. Z5]SHE26477.1 peptidase a8 signal peptidase ii [Actinomyces glycerinitolerans]
MSETPEPVTPIRPTSAGTPDTPTSAGMPEATKTASVRRPHRPLAALWTLAVAVVAVDQLTKVWAVAALSDGHRVRVLGDWLTLTLLRNPGAAFSFATGQTWIFALIAIIVTVVVIRISRRLGSMWWAVALGLVLGGAVGNLIDRLVRAPGVLRGHVVDFIDYGGWFVGNVADIAIVGAAVIIMVLSVRGRELDGSRAGEGRGRHAETDA